MREEDILNALELPKSTWVMRTFPFNQLAKKLKMSQRKILTEGIISRGIRILATINSKNTNLKKYENELEYYEEIHIFLIELRDLKYTKKVFSILNSIIPYPLMIIFSSEGNCQIVTGDYEKKSKTLHLKEIYISSETDDLLKFLSDIRFDSLDKSNLKQLYNDYIMKIINIELYQKYGVNNTSLNAPELLRNLNELDREIEKLINKAKKEKQINHRIEYQIKANKLKESKEIIIQGGY